jgi:TRAP-type mannitol/chloroaromatic compound transport system substrate-binding protein
MPKVIRLCAIALTACAALAAPLRPGLAAEHTWNMQTEWGGGPLMDLGAKAFAEKIKFLTDGRIEVQVLPAGTLAKGLEARTAVANGVAEACHTWIGYDWGKDKTTVLFGGFSGSMDSERMLHWLYEGGGAELQRQFSEEKFDLVSIPMFARTAEAFLHSRKPVRTMEDLKGLKLRTAGAWLEISKQMGAASVTTPGRGHRRHRMGHAIREHLDGLPQDRQVRDHSRRAPAVGAIRAVRQQERLG